MDYALGIDLGGRNVKGVALTRRGRVLAETRVPTGRTDQAGWERSVRRAMRGLERAVGGRAKWVGLAAPGLPAGDGGSIRHMPGRFVGLEGLDWSGYLRAGVPVPVLNDAQAALLGEIWRGAARGARNAVLLTLGTGVGGAAVVDGHLLRGHLGRAGHFGHITLDPAGNLDITNAPGSLEDAVGDASVGERSRGRFGSTRELVEAVRARDADARRIWETAMQALAAGLVSLVNVLDPEVVIIGGGITSAGQVLFRPLRRWVGRFEWRPGGARVRLVGARLGDRAGAVGAAWNAISPQRDGSDHGAPSRSW